MDAQNKISLHDRIEAAQAAQNIKRDKDRAKPIPDIACDCGCGVWPERVMYYYVIADKYFRNQYCADRYFKIKRWELNRWAMAPKS